MQSIISRVINFANSHNKKYSGDLLNEYIKIFYLQSVGKDFIGYSDEDLFNLAFLSFEFFSQKPVNNFKIRLSNPNKNQNGFDCNYTIVDIINDDMPFLVDSVVMQFDNCGIEIKNILHPILTAKRSADGKIISFVKEGDIANESIMQLHLARISDDQIDSLKLRLTEILETVKMVVGDWRGMINLAKKSSHNFRQQNAKIAVDNKAANNVGFDIAEAANFIDWIVDNKFIFLGAIEFDIEHNGDNYSYKEVLNSRLGIYKSQYEITKPTIVNVSPKEIEGVVGHPYLVEILKSRYKSQIHRYTNAERIRIQKFDDNGKVVGEYRFIGLFASSVYYQNPKSIPIICKKIEQVTARSGYSKNSSNFKDLLSTLESYPRDELFQIEQDDLLRIATGIVAISGRSLVRMFVRYDKFSRFVSCLIFIPRDNFNTALREKVQNLVAEAYCGEISDVFVQIADSNLTRLHLVVRTDSGIANVNVDELEQRLIKVCRLWSDEFKDEVIAFNDDKAKEILALYQDAFSISYTNRFNPKDAIIDVEQINQSLDSGLICCNLYRANGAISDNIELKIYSPENKLLLSEIMPILDSFGFNVVLEHTYLVSPKGKKNVWIHYFNLNLGLCNAQLTEEIRVNFIETITKIWLRETKIGHFNRLVVASGLNWRQIYLLRAYSKYLYQIGLRYSQNQLSDVLVKYCDLTKLLVDLFEAKFNPGFVANRSESIADIASKIKDGLDKISDVTEDNVIRRFFNIVQETLRTNFYQKTPDGKSKNYLSFKLNSAKIIDLPLPLMYAEIFVYSVEFEGIHLRGGKVARGGLRWSDRHDDFRTEVLGLVKAQMTKNAVIVPVGSKGGFVVQK